MRSQRLRLARKRKRERERRERERKRERERVTLKKHTHTHKRFKNLLTMYKETQTCCCPMPAWTCYNTQAAFHSLSSVAHPAVAASTLIVEAQGAWSTVRIQSLDPFQAPYPHITLRLRPFAVLSPICLDTRLNSRNRERRSGMVSSYTGTAG